MLNKYLKISNYINRVYNRYLIQIEEIYLKKTAKLINTKYREQMLAYTIAGQGKSLYEAEIDAICELSDFMIFNQKYAKEIVTRQPISTPGIKNTSMYNPLNGFVAAITPFNFTAIGGNLASTPTLFGNSVDLETVTSIYTFKLFILRNSL